MPFPHRNSTWQTLHWALSPVLAFVIYLSLLNLNDTYDQVEHYQRESIWSLVHLNTQLNSAQYDMQLYSHGKLSEKELRIRYELIWSKFPVLLSNLKKDDMLKQVKGLRELIENTFAQIRAMEAEIYSGDGVNIELLPVWIAEINHAHESIQRHLLHEVTDSKGSYNQAVWEKLLKAIYYVAGSSIIFIAHIGYLLMTLARERAASNFQLSYDALTGLASRNNTMQSLHKRCEANKPFTLAIIDLDKFKQVNDNHGHLAGDHVLKHLSAAFKKTLSKHGMVGRLGGDEFAWLVDITDQKLLARYYVELIKELEAPCTYEQTKFNIQLSTGASINHGDHLHPKTMLTQADRAMYQAKEMNGSDEIIWYEIQTDNHQNSPTASMMT
ncbi:MAG: diguanylate cyclase domain-containing protein [Thiolinea sp.]